MSIASIVSNAGADLVESVKPSVVQVKAGTRGIGTGVIWRGDAQRGTTELVTNAHVVAGAHGAINVTVYGGATYAATVVAANNALDLALLQIPAAGLQAAHIAAAGAARVGEAVFAVGNPWGQVGVVTRGVLGAVGAIDMRNGRRAAYLRSDVALAPGNSGGPMLNMAGQVIGINAMIFGGDLSVAIPADVVIEWIAGQPERPVRLGIGVQSVRLPDNAEALLVVKVDADGPAAASLLVGDVLLGVGDERARTLDDFQGALARAARRPGRARLHVLRGGRPAEIDVPVGVF
jgi:serine protease Do